MPINRESDIKDLMKMPVTVQANTQNIIMSFLQVVFRNPLH